MTRAPALGLLRSVENVWNSPGAGLLFIKMSVPRLKSILDKPVGVEEYERRLATEIRAEESPSGFSRHPNLQGRGGTRGRPLLFILELPSRTAPVHIKSEGCEFGDKYDAGIASAGSLKCPTSRTTPPRVVHPFCFPSSNPRNSQNPIKVPSSRLASTLLWRRVKLHRRCSKRYRTFSIRLGRLRESTTLSASNHIPKPCLLRFRVSKKVLTESVVLMQSLAGDVETVSLDE
jgi:hypothetical protein